MDARMPVPPRYAGRRFESLEAALADGPKFFVELMSARGSRDGREVVRELETLRQSGWLERDAEGRYVYRPAAAAR
jgi:predicted transcriptional regulator